MRVPRGRNAAGERGNAHGRARQLTTLRGIRSFVSSCVGSRVRRNGLDRVCLAERLPELVFEFDEVGEDSSRSRRMTWAQRRTFADRIGDAPSQASGESCLLQAAQGNVQGNFRDCSGGAEAPIRHLSGAVGTFFEGAFASLGFEMRVDRDVQIGGNTGGSALDGNQQPKGRPLLPEKGSLCAHAPAADTLKPHVFLIHSSHLALFPGNRVPDTVNPALPGSRVARGAQLLRT